MHIFLLLLFVLLVVCSTTYYREGYTDKTQTQTQNTVIVKKNTPSNTTVAVKKEDIPPGDEDLYILKTEVVPPVCPACPVAAACPREKPCPACPPCARCPEHAFECKKVPNYSSTNDQYLPRPVMNDFSSF